MMDDESKRLDGMDLQYQAYVNRQKSWGRGQDELLVAFVNEAVEDSAMDLAQLVELSFDQLTSMSPVTVVPEKNQLQGSGFMLALINDRMTLVKPEAEELIELAGGAVGGPEGDEEPSSASEDYYILGEAKIRKAVFEAVMDDIAQRYDLLRALNKSVHDALGLLDLSAYKDPSSSAFHLSECSSLLFDKFKVPLWNDAITSTKAEDIHRFDVVLDFGKAMSKKHIADIHGRHTIFAQAFRVIHPMPAKTLRAHGKLYKCVMRGMSSHDDGGPYRQSFSEYCNELQSLPGVGLFLPCSNRANQIRVNRDKWLPNPSATSPVQISMFEFVGKLMGIAIRNTELLDLRLPSLVWKPLVNQVPNLQDLQAVDVLTVSNTDVDTVELSALSAQEMYFTVITLDGREVELVPNGSSIPVTADNFQEWSERTRDFKIHEFDVQVEAIRRGLASIVPQKLLLLFRWDELELMVCGKPKVDLNLLKKMTVYSDCSENDSHVQFFWKALETFTEEQRSNYIKFVWGRSRIPMDKEQWEQPHKIAGFHPPRPAFGKPPPHPDSLLPFAHTCYFTLDLPCYSNLEVTKRKLLYAIDNCPEIDGDQTTTGRRAAAMGFDIGESDDDDEDELSDQDNDPDGEIVLGNVPSSSAAAAAAVGAGSRIHPDIELPDDLPPSPPPPSSVNPQLVDSLPHSNRQLRLDTIAENITNAAAGNNNGNGGPSSLLRNRRFRLDLGNSSGLTRQSAQFSLSNLLQQANALGEDPFGEFVDLYGNIGEAGGTSDNNN